MSLEVSNMVQSLSVKIETELEDFGRQTQQVSIEELQGAGADDGKVYAFQLEDIPGVYKEGKKKPDSLYPAPEHEVPRGDKIEDELENWRKNHDYLESPYMNMDIIDKITDTPPFKKKKKDD